MANDKRIYYVSGVAAEDIRQGDIVCRDPYHRSVFYRPGLAESITADAVAHLETMISDARARIWLRQFGQDITDVAAERAEQGKRRRQ
jgi:hypothetical protein